MPRAVGGVLLGLLGVALGLMMLEDIKNLKHYQRPVSFFGLGLMIAGVIFSLYYLISIVY